jgi:LppX_LprAFG lipoprotein
MLNKYHPLVAIEEISMKTRSLSILALGMMILIAACNNSSVPSADSLIQKASSKFSSDTSLHFVLKAKNIKPGAFSVVQATGDVVRPDKLKASGSVEPFAGTQLPINVIFIGGAQYLGIGGSYNKTDQLPNLVVIFDSKQGIGAILGQFKKPGVPSSEDVAGVNCWKIAGTVDSTLLNPITGSTNTTASPVSTTLWIGQSDGQIHQVSLQGIATDGDTADTTRTFTLSNFNENITITAPTAS